MGCRYHTTRQGWYICVTEKVLFQCLSWARFRRTARGVTSDPVIRLVAYRLPERQLNCGRFSINRNNDDRGDVDCLDRIGQNVWWMFGA